jgi:hypothetical protein
MVAARTPQTQRALAGFADNGVSLAIPIGNPFTRFRVHRSFQVAFRICGK